MSLNGLDTATITDAFQATLAEPGGWLLLKYTSRDEVDVLARGSGGVADLRDAISAYTEPSPLYGFLRFRRRSVLLKYIPEGTSRLLQARVAVHFSSITDKFSPHDTIFSIAAPKDLKENALSAACSLHAASHSTSSSTSSTQRPRLGEIVEDAEESRTSRGEMEKPLPPLPGEDRPSTAMARRDSSRHAKPDARTSEDTERAIRDAVQAATSPAENHMGSNATTPTHSRRPSTPTPFSLYREGDDRRMSSSSARPAIRDLYSYGLKPKIKLGPRPSLDIKRPHTSGAEPRQFEIRPVSSLPAGLRVAPRKAVPPPSKAKPQQHSAPNIHLAVTPPTDTDSPRSLASPSGSLSPMPPPTSLGSPLPSHTPSKKRPAVSPEKKRLMKALQLRKKQMEASSQEPPASEGQPTLEQDQALAGPNHGPCDILPEEASTPQDNETKTVEILAETPNVEDPKTADPIVTEEETRQEDVSVDKTGSSPVSTAESPEPASTKASSLSDQTEQQPSDSTERATTDSINPQDNSEVTHESLSDSDPTSGEATQDPPANRSASEAVTDIHVVGSEVDKEKLDMAATDPLESETIIEGTQEPPKDAPSEIEDDTEASTKTTTEPAAESEYKVEEPRAPVPVTNEAQAEAEGGSFFIDEEAEPMPTNEDGGEIINGNSVSLPSFDTKITSETSRNGALDGSEEQGRLGASSAEGMLTSHERSHGDQLSSTDDTPRTSVLVEEASFSTSETGSKRGSLEHSQSPLKKKRRGLVDPIRTDLSPENSDDNLLSDDSLMNELRTATVQEAKPVSVRKSPVASTFPRRRTDSWLRAASNPSVPVLASTRHSPVMDASSEKQRTASGSFISTNGHKNSPIAMIKKINVSSGISQRIKALELLSSQTNAPVTPPLSSSSTPNASPSVAGLRQSNARSPSTKQASSPAQAKRITMIGPSTPEAQMQPSSPRTESVSVKAQIVKDPVQSYSQRLDTVADPSDPSSPLELHESPLVIEHHPASSQAQGSRIKSPKTDRPLSALLQRSDPTSPVSTRRPSIASKNSASSGGRNEAKSPPASRKSSSSGNHEEKKDVKKESTTSRIFRRMSSISGASRKSVIHTTSPTVKEEESMGEAAAAQEPRRGSIDVGEVNVQFPDSLLWKRRYLKLDSLGYINLTQSTSDEFSRNGTKRYHLSEFKAPFAPDQDGQELPNSVILDFREGGTLQCACEHPAGQEHVLKSLAESYRNWVK